MCDYGRLFAVLLLSIFLARRIDAAALMEQYGQHFRHQTNGYLPPLGNAQFGDKTHAATSAYKTPAAQTDSFEPIYNSYVPPASGAVSLQYSRVQSSNKASIPMLVAIDQLSTPSALYEQAATTHPQTRHPHDREQQLPTDANALLPLLMVEEPAEMYLAPNHNRTIEAARLLASTLLEASGDAPLQRQHNGLADGSNLVNMTDVLIVKSHKNAYIIPAQLAKAGKNAMSARELYEMRNQLEKAYVINQFIFIIKPDRINFLNKLV